MSSKENKRYNRPLSDDEAKRAKIIAGILSISALIFMGGLYLLVENDMVRLHPQNTSSETLKGFASRVEYTLRYQTLLVFWLVFNILATIGYRFKTMALNPLDSKAEEQVQPIKNILTNSYESIVVSVFSQLTFIGYAEPASVLKLIPYVNIVQFIGRIAFFAGYPLKRSFGYVCTIVPNLFLVGYNLYKLGSFVGIY